MWKDIPGYDGVYQASTEGQVRRVLKNGQFRLLKPYCHKNGECQQYVIGLITPSGKRKESTITRIIAETFLGPCPDGYVAYRINRAQNDNNIKNIKYIPLKELGAKIGASSHRRPVVKIDASGEIVACYSSARAAGRANNLSYHAVTSRCNGKVKKPFALDGYDYQWDDLEEQKEKRKRLKKNKAVK